MDLLDSLKKIYTGLTTKIIVADKNFEILWKNSDDLPKTILKSDFKYDDGDLFELPLNSEIITRHHSGCAVKIAPVFSDNKLDGYLLSFYSPAAIETLSGNSDRAFYKNNFLGNIRLELAEIISHLDDSRALHANEDEFVKFYHKTRYHILRTFATTVNMNEITKLHAGNISSEYVNLSKRLGETVDWAEPMFNKNSCEIVTEIDDGIFLNINYTRLELALLNLMINALMYNDATKKVISISLTESGGHIILNVSDNGTKADLEHICQYTNMYHRPFQYSKNESMGIAVANAMVSYFGGSLEFTSSPTGGLSATMKFQSSPDNLPKVFKLKRFPPIISQFDPQYCILSKGLDPIE